MGQQQGRSPPQAPSPSADPVPPAATAAGSGPQTTHKSSKAGHGLERQVCVRELETVPEQQSEQEAETPGRTAQQTAPPVNRPTGDDTEREVGCQGPTRVRRLFRRHSSIKVCPEDFPGGGGLDSPGCESLRGGERTDSTPSPMDANKNSVLLFSGTLCPIALGDSTDAEEGFLSPMQLYNSMNDGQLSPYMFDPTFMLIIDTRAFQDYQQLHISTAVHVSELSDTEKVESLDTYTLIILYDHKGLSHSLVESALSKTVADIQSQGIEPFILAGGFDTFYSKHPYLCTWRVPTTGLERQMIIKCYPSIVLEDQLYLGRADQAANVKVVRKLGLTHIVNITRDHPNTFQEEIQYFKVEVDDENTANLLREFPTLIHFINDALSQGGRVLVHCNLGRSRSSTVVIAYLMYSRRCSLRDAYHFLKERRPVIHPNRGFLNQLTRFEEILFGRKLTNPEHVCGSS